MSRYLFNKYTALAIGIQFLGCLVVWAIAFATSPADDKLFGLMFYFYLPAIFLVSTVLGLTGESGMISAAIYGIAFGILVYGVILGFVISYLKRGR